MLSLSCLGHSRGPVEALIITMMQKCHHILHAPHFLLQFFFFFSLREGEGDGEKEKAQTF